MKLTRIELEAEGWRITGPDMPGLFLPHMAPKETNKNANDDIVRLPGSDTYVIDESAGPVPKPGYWQEVCVPEPPLAVRNNKGDVLIQAPPAEVPKSAKPGCKCGAHRKNQFDGQLLGTPDVFPVLAFVRKAKFPTWYVTVPSVARLRINDIHSDSIHLIPDMVRAEIDKLTGRKIASERVHLVFPHDQRNPQL